jgi:hypothetical protein
LSATSPKRFDFSSSAVFTVPLWGSSIPPTFLAADFQA